jgi:uncharacterized protein with PIN domain
VSTGGGYTAEQRRAIAAALDADTAAPCPVCGAELTRQRVEPLPAVPYVRRRVWVLCPRCRRTASVDVKVD